MTLLTFDPSVDIIVLPPNPVRIAGRAALCDMPADEIERDYLPAVLDTLAGSSVSGGTGNGLFDRRGVAPTVERIDLVHRLVAFSAERGLYLPATILVRFVVGAPGDPRGSAAAQGRLFAIAVADSVPDDDVPALMFHELMHVADFLAGGHEAGEREVRAIRFAWHAVSAWSEAGL